MLLRPVLNSAANYSGKSSHNSLHLIIVTVLYINNKTKLDGRAQIN